MQVFDLCPTCISFGHPLALTCIEFGCAQIRTQVFCLFRGPPNARQHKLIARQLNMHEIYNFL